MTVLLIVLGLFAIPLVILLMLIARIRRTLSRPFNSPGRQRVAVIIGNAAIGLDVFAVLAAAYFTVILVQAIVVELRGGSGGGFSGLLLLVAPAILIVAILWSAVAYLICILLVS